MGSSMGWEGASSCETVEPISHYAVEITFGDPRLLAHPTEDRELRRRALRRERRALPRRAVEVAPQPNGVEARQIEQIGERALLEHREAMGEQDVADPRE